jgi:hypothetical protein
MPDLRPDLPPLPHRLKGLPVVRGYPVPYFAARGPDGEYDFRLMDPAKFKAAIEQRRCWICGAPLLERLAFVVGPMCTINRTTAEPPSHGDCATWAAQACPFLAQRQVRRREAGLPDGLKPMPGIGFTRQPGVAVVWVTRSAELWQPAAGEYLLTMGSPLAVSWYAHGRQATRAEVLVSIESGYPSLLALAEEEGPEAVAALTRLREAAEHWLPAE